MVRHKTCYASSFSVDMEYANRAEVKADQVGLAPPYQLHSVADEFVIVSCLPSREISVHMIVEILSFYRELTPLPCIPKFCTERTVRECFARSHVK